MIRGKILLVLVVITITIIIGFFSYARYTAPSPSKFKAELENVRGLNLLTTKPSYAEVNFTTLHIYPNGSSQQLGRLGISTPQEAKTRITVIDTWGDVKFMLSEDDIRIDARFTYLNIEQPVPAKLVTYVSQAHLPFDIYGVIILIPATEEIQRLILPHTQTISLLFTGGSSINIYHGERSLFNYSTTPSTAVTLKVYVEKPATYRIQLPQSAYAMQLSDWKLFFVNPGFDVANMRISRAGGQIEHKLGTTSLKGIESVELFGRIEPFTLTQAFVNNDQTLLLEGEASELRVEGMDISKPSPYNDIISLAPILSVVSLIIATASPFIGKRWGEMAASKYILEEGKRKEHAQLLTAELPGNIDIPDISILLVVSRNIYNELVKDKVNIRSNLSSNLELLFSHLETGYNDLYKEIMEYERCYNNLIDRVTIIYKKALDIMNEATAKHSIKWSVSSARVIEGFSVEVNSTLYIKNPLKKSEISGYNVRLGSYELASANNMEEAQKIRDIVNSLFENEEIFGKLKMVWKEAQPLKEKRKTIEKELERIKTYVNAGVNLSGSCSAGKEAGYEK